MSRTVSDVKQSIARITAELMEAIEEHSSLRTETAQLEITGGGLLDTKGILNRRHATPKTSHSPLEQKPEAAPKTRVEELASKRSAPDDLRSRVESTVDTVFNAYIERLKRQAREGKATIAAGGDPVTAPITGIPLHSKGHLHHAHLKTGNRTAEAKARDEALNQPGSYRAKEQTATTSTVKTAHAVSPADAPLFHPDPKPPTSPTPKETSNEASKRPASRLYPPESPGDLRSRIEKTVDIIFDAYIDRLKSQAKAESIRAAKAPASQQPAGGGSSKEPEALSSSQQPAAPAEIANRATGDAAASVRRTGHHKFKANQINKMFKKKTNMKPEDGGVRPGDVVFKHSAGKYEYVPPESATETGRFLLRSSTGLAILEPRTWDDVQNIFGANSQI